MFIINGGRHGCHIISSQLAKLNPKTYSFHHYSLFQTETTKQPNLSSPARSFKVHLHNITRFENTADTRLQTSLKLTEIQKDKTFKRTNTNIFFECQNSLDSFKASFELFVQDLINFSILNADDSFGLTSQQAERIKNVFYYNLTNGKNLRSYLFLECYKHLRGEALKKEELNYIHKIGWIFETNHSFACFMDDIMDAGETRHGHTCWYRLPEVGYRDAIIDGLMLEHGYFLLLQKYMAEKPYCLNVLTLFHETNYHTSCGQLLDMLTAKYRKFTNNGKDKILLFADIKMLVFYFILPLISYNMKLYTDIVTKKTGYYTFFNPIATSLLMNGIRDEDLIGSIKKMSLNLSMLFQIQDDFLDCFGDPNKIKKAGTDIQEGKCSWLVVKALENASVAQKHILVNNFGSSDAEKIAKVKELYIQLGIPSLYAEYEALEYENILTQIQLLPSFMPKSLFERVVQRLCRRSF